MPDVKAVVFDIGNVLIEWQPERFFDSVVGPARRQEMFAAIDMHGMNDRVDQGQNFHAVLAETKRDYPAFEAELDIWESRWIDLAGPVIPHSVRILQALRAAGVPVFALSNFGVETFAMAEPVYPFLRDFDRRYISGHMGCVKPWSPIYEQLEADCGVAPAGLLFADDRQENLDAAAIRGWQTHLFETPQGWADRLVAEGLLTAEAAQ